MTVPDRMAHAADDARPFPGSLPEPDRDLELKLISMLRSHGAREGAALTNYERLVDESDDEGLRYLAGLILEDERRHHAVIEQMLNQIHSFVWEVDVQPSVPAIRRTVDPAVRAETQRLLRFEREDAKELRQLRRVLRRSPDRSSLLPLLVELMIHDTAKHIEILKFIRRHTGRR